MSDSQKKYDLIDKGIDLFIKENGDDLSFMVDALSSTIAEGIQYRFKDSSTGIMVVKNIGRALTKY